MPNPTMGEVADIDIPSNTSGQVVAPIGVGGVQVVAGTATPIRTYANQGQGTWGALHPTGVVPVKPVRTGNVLGTSVIEEPEVVTPIPNATPTVTTTILPMPIGGGMFGGGGGGGAGSGDSTDSVATAKKPNYLMYALIALGAYLAYKTFSKKEK